MDPRKARLRCRAAALGLLALGWSCGPFGARADEAGARIERRLEAMGTLLSMVVDAPTRTAALGAGERVAVAVARAESRLSTWTAASELARLNSQPVDASVPISPELARDLENARRCAEVTSGAFSPGMGFLVRAWGLREGGRLPAAAQIARGTAAAAPGHLRLDGRRATRLHPDFLVEEGGFGKGVALDDALEALVGAEATGALVDLGGQVSLWGAATATVLIADPRDRGRQILRFDVHRGSVATSSNSERGIVVEGRRLGHLLDPRSGRPAPDFGSVTVWADRGVDADCLATGLHVLGPQAAIAWGADHDDVSVVIVEQAGNTLVAHASAHLRGTLHVAVEDLELRWIASVRAETR